MTIFVYYLRNAVKFRREAQLQASRISNRYPALVVSKMGPKTDCGGADSLLARPDLDKTSCLQNLGTERAPWHRGMATLQVKKTWCPMARLADAS